MTRLAKKVIEILSRKKLTISIAESCTGGLVSSLMTRISGSSKALKLGVITYSNISKINLLKVPKKIINKHGAVSPETCKYMLKGLKRISPTHLGVSITGIAGPMGGSKLKPVGLVYIGIRKNRKILIKKYLFKEINRTQIQNLSAKKVLELILSFCK